MRPRAVLPFSTAVAAPFPPPPYDPDVDMLPPEPWPPPPAYLERWRTVVRTGRATLEYAWHLDASWPEIPSPVSVEALARLVRYAEDVLRAAEAGDREVYERAQRQGGVRPPSAQD